MTKLFHSDSYSVVDELLMTLVFIQFQGSLGGIVPRSLYIHEDEPDKSDAERPLFGDNAYTVVSIKEGGAHEVCLNFFMLINQ